MPELLARNWGMVVLRGVAAVLFGLLILFVPAITFAVLIFYFGALALIDGIATVVAAATNRVGAERRGWYFVSGVLGIIAGLVTFFWPGVTALALLYVIAIWAIVMGAGEIAAAVRLRQVIEGEWVLMLAGVISVVFGILIAIFPGAGALALVLWIGWFALVVGILRIILGLRLRGSTRATV